MLTQAMRVGWPYGSIPSSARRPASVIRTRATSILRPPPPTVTRWLCLVILFKRF